MENQIIVSIGHGERVQGNVRNGNEANLPRLSPTGAKQPQKNFTHSKTDGSSAWRAAVPPRCFPLEMLRAKLSFAVTLTKFPKHLP